MKRRRKGLGIGTESWQEPPEAIVGPAGHYPPAGSTVGPDGHYPAHN